MLTKEKKEQIIKDFRTSDTDTGSCGVQIALLTERINQIAAHLKGFPKDKHSRYGLIKLVCKRRAFEKYLRKHDPEQLEKISKRLVV
jgi:small subunit ribosomal protein S15